jgi:hypothetical protein
MCVTHTFTQQDLWVFPNGEGHRYWVFPQQITHRYAFRYAVRTFRICRHPVPAIDSPLITAINQRPRGLRTRPRTVGFCRLAWVIKTRPANRYRSTHGGYLIFSPYKKAGPPSAGKRHPRRFTNWFCRLAGVRFETVKTGVSRRSWGYRRGYKVHL